MNKNLADDAYIVDFHAAITNELTRRHRHPSAEDVAQTETVRLLENLETVRASYPNAKIYASARAHHAGIDYDRREAVQRGEGARLSRQPDGSVRRTRVVATGDAPNPTTGLSIFDRLADRADPIEDIQWQFDPRLDLIRASLANESVMTRELVVMVKAEGYTVTEAAQRLGIDRTTGSRRLNRALGAIYAAADECGFR